MTKSNLINPRDILTIALTIYFMYNYALKHLPLFRVVGDVFLYYLLS